jgi:hypothetical protein
MKMKGEAVVTDINKAVDSAVERVIQDFQHCPGCYFTEEDVRWRLMKEIDNNLLNLDVKYAQLKNGVLISLVHGEYPTPFRCSMKGRSFDLKPKGSDVNRGHFDIAVLNPQAVAECEFEVVRSQYYRRFIDLLEQEKLPLPFLDCVIEIKLYRDMAHPNRTESAKRQAEYAIQAVRKVDTTLQSNEYYKHPFSKRGIVLLFDNSDLVCNGDAKLARVELARNQFLKGFKEYITQSSLPSTLSCIWVTQQRGKIPILPYKTHS